MRDELRVPLYLLLARLLTRPPDRERLKPFNLLAPLLKELEGLGDRLRRTPEGVIEEEFHRLLIGIGRGEVLPDASWYQARLLNAAPLAAVRRDLRALGLERQEGVAEPEDHLAFLYEAVALLLEEGKEDGAQRLLRRRVFPWSDRFWRDLATASGAGFYGEVAAVGIWFDRQERLRS